MSVCRVKGEGRGLQMLSHSTACSGHKSEECLEVDSKLCLRAVKLDPHFTIIFPPGQEAGRFIPKKIAFYFNSYRFWAKTFFSEHPATLQEHCKRVIRKLILKDRCINFQFAASIRSLPLPILLKDFLISPPTYWRKHKVNNRVDIKEHRDGTLFSLHVMYVCPFDVVRITFLEGSAPLELVYVHPLHPAPVEQFVLPCKQ